MHQAEQGGSYWSNCLPHFFPHQTQKGDIDIHPSAPKTFGPDPWQIKGDITGDWLAEMLFLRTTG